MEVKANNQPKRPRGRPPGTTKPKKPKVAKPIGRPSVWPEELRPTASARHKVPVVFDEFLEIPEFREKFTDLLLDFRRRK